MSLPFLSLLNIVLLSRLVLTFCDEPVTTRKTIGMIVFQIAGVLAAFGVGLTPLLLALALALITIMLSILERKSGQIYIFRIATLFFQILVAGIFLSERFGPPFNLSLLNAFASLGVFFIPLYVFVQSANWQALTIILMGLLLVVNEANIAIRYILHTFNLEPKRDKSGTQADALDVRQYNAGRIIGILERVIIYFLVLNVQYAAIGFILAAKSFTRFREMEDREIAEYILIGTLLSALVAMLVGRLVLAVIS